MKRISVFVLGMCLVGCRLLVDVDTPQCTKDVHCTGLFGPDYMCGDHGVCVEKPPPDPEEARFACIGQPVEVPEKPKSGEVHLSVQIVDFLSLKPAEGVTLNACSIKDSMCATPIVEGATLDKDGYASTDLPFGFDGYFEATGGDYVPALFTINRPVYTDLELAGPSLLTATSLSALAATNQDTIDATKGVVVVEVVDCNDEAAEGVVIEIDGLPDLSRFYIDGSLPNLNLSSTKISTGISAGGLPRAVGGFTNVPAGFQTVHTTLEATGEDYGRATIIVRPDTMTFVRVYPGVVD